MNNYFVISIIVMEGSFLITFDYVCTIFFIKDVVSMLEEQEWFNLALVSKKFHSAVSMCYEELIDKILKPNNDVVDYTIRYGRSYSLTRYIKYENQDKHFNNTLARILYMSSEYNKVCFDEICLRTISYVVKYICSAKKIIDEFVTRFTLFYESDYKVYSFYWQREDAHDYLRIFERLCKCNKINLELVNYNISCLECMPMKTYKYIINCKNIRMMRFVDF